MHNDRKEERRTIQRVIRLRRLQDKNTKIYNTIKLKLKLKQKIEEQLVKNK